MLIFNITFLVSDQALNQWLEWVNNDHIPFMLESGKLQQPQIARVLSDNGQEGTSYAVQFYVKDMETLNQWHQHFGDEFQRKCAENFSQDEVMFFSTVLEIV